MYGFQTSLGTRHVNAAVLATEVFAEVHIRWAFPPLDRASKILHSILWSPRKKEEKKRRNGPERIRSDQRGTSSTTIKMDA
jgi:hypothetical protein